MTKKSLPIFALYIAFSSGLVQAADEIFCDDYARELINIPTDSESTQKLCQKGQSHWNEDKAVHIKWCLSVDEATADKKRYNHNQLVNLCNDSYKLIMIDRKRVASLAISDKEEMQMDSATPVIQKGLTTATIKTPYSELFTKFNTAIKEGKLKECNLFSLAVELDKSPETKEWVISTESTCLEDHQEHIWLVQQIEDKYHILFEGENNTFNIRYSENKESQYKNISISTTLTMEEETDKRCGTIHADWHYVAGRYIPFKGKAIEGGNCLPEYNVPDSLQGKNTFELAEGEWEKRMLIEEKKRIALFAPYKQALKDYIPKWISHIETKVPADPLAIAINTPQTGANTDTKETAEVSPTLSSKPETETETETTKEKPKKSFFENMRAFLGLD